MDKSKDRNLDRRIAELTHKLNLFDLEEVLDAAIEQIPVILQANRVSIYLLDPEERHFVAKRRSSNKLQEHFVEKIAVDSPHSIITHVLGQNEPVLIQDVREYIEKHGLDITVSRRQRYTSGACMILPIKVKLPKTEKILGVLNVAEKNDFTTFSKYDLDLAHHLVELLGTSIHNCVVVEKKLGGRQKELLTQLDDIKEAFAQKDIQLDEAKKKQSQMLPDLPKIEGYDVHVYYSPMETIGGDFYDFIQISEHEIGIVVGDVSGHGIEAALVMSMAKQILNIYSKLHRSLIETVAQANDEIFSNLKGESFVAVFLGILDTKTHVLRYVRAGQTYPILYNEARNPHISEIKSAGSVLGTVRGRGERFRSMVEEKYIQFQPGDTLLLYTDGLVEATDPQGDDFSLERILQGVEKMGRKSAAEITQALERDVRNFIQGPQDDDITILCIQARNIVPGVAFNTQRLEKSMLEDAESYIVTPELSYDESVQYQMLELEEKIADLESQVEELTQANGELEDRCEELSAAVEMATNDPGSYMASLKEQLQMALELPRELIAENQRLHQDAAAQKRELQVLESELDEVVGQTRLLKEENKSMENQFISMQSMRQDCGHEMRREILSSVCHFEKKVLEFLDRSEYEEAMQVLEKYTSLAIERLDLAAIAAYQQQLFYLSRLFLKYLRDFTGTPQ